MCGDGTQCHDTLTGAGPSVAPADVDTTPRGDGVATRMVNIITGVPG